MATNRLFSLQGSFYTLKRKADNSLDLASKTWLGNVSTATIEISVDKEEKKESFSGNRGLYGTLITGKTATLNMTLDEWTQEGLALGLYGQEITIPAKTITGEVFPGVADGEIITLDNLFISDLVIKDSASTPIELKLGVHYTVESTTSATIKLLDVTTLSQPLKADYKAAETSSIAIFSNVQAPERFLMFEGVDTLSGNKVHAELYRVQFDPTSSFGLIDDSFGALELTGNLLIDSERMDDSMLGGYARIVTNQAALGTTRMLSAIAPLTASADTQSQPNPDKETTKKNTTK